MMIKKISCGLKTNIHGKSRVFVDVVVFVVFLKIYSKISLQRYCQLLSQIPRAVILYITLLIITSGIRLHYDLYYIRSD